MAPSSDAEQGLPALAAPSPSPMDPFGKGAGRHDSIVRLRDKASSMDEGDIIVKPLTPLVAMPPPSDAVVNSTLSRQNYSRLGRNLLFEARPAVRQATFDHILISLEMRGSSAYVCDRLTTVSMTMSDSGDAAHPPRCDQEHGEKLVNVRKAGVVECIFAIIPASRQKLIVAHNKTRSYIFVLVA